MKKFYVVPLFMLLCHVLTAQTVLDTMLVNVNKSSVTSGIIYERVTQFANLYNFNKPNYPNTADYKYLRQGLDELHRASNQTKLISLNTLEARIAATTNTNKVDVAIINSPFQILNYNADNPSAGGLTLNTTTQRFAQIANQSPFYTMQTTIVTPTKSVLEGKSVVFQFKNNLYITNGGNAIKTMTINFGSSSSTIISNSVLQVQTVTVPYTSSGTKEFTCQITFNNNDTLTTKGSFYLNYKSIRQSKTKSLNGNCTALDARSKDEFVEAEEAFKGYATNDPRIISEVDYRIFYADASFHSDLNVYKPVIIVDGFDPGDKRKIQDCDCEEDTDCASENLTNGVFDPLRHRAMTDLMEYENEIGESSFILEQLRGRGYDVIMVNHPTYRTTNIDNGQQVKINGGAYYIESNALALVALIKKVKLKMAAVNSTEEIAIVGPSMGGQISRYALAYMENKYDETNDEDWNHNTGLWVSVDSPHLGANIPIGDQSLLYMAGKVAGSEAAEDFYNNQLGSPAAKQQLIELHENPTRLISSFPFGPYQNNENNLNGRVASQGYGSDDGSSYYRTYYNKQENNGLANSHGYPENLRKIALVNGSMTGKTIGVDSELVLNIRGFQNVDIDLPWPFGSINFDVHIASLESQFMPKEFTGNQRVSRFKAGFDDVRHYTPNINSRGNMDIAPGGWFPAQKDIADSVMGTTPIEGGTGSFWGYPGANLTYWFSNVLGGSFFSLRDLRPEHSFISSFSAIAHKNPDQSWLNPLDYNLVCTDETYFDSYFGHDENTQHTSFNAESANWLFEELSGNPQDPYFPISSDQLVGDDFLCDMATYAFDICKIPGDVTNWSVSPNIQILSSTGTSISVDLVSANGSSGWIKATFNNDIEIIKNIWVGKPKALTTSPDPTICINVFDQTSGYSLPISPGADSYQLTSNSTNLFVDATATPGQPIGMMAAVAGNYTITLTTTNTCGTKQATIYVTAENCGGGFGSFRVMQNPVESESLIVIETDELELNNNGQENHNDQGIVNGNEDKVTLELYDFSGNLLKTKKVKRNHLDKKYPINISQYDNGNYFIRIIYKEIDEVYQVIFDK